MNSLRTALLGAGAAVLFVGGALAQQAQQPGQGQQAQPGQQMQSGQQGQRNRDISRQDLTQFFDRLEQQVTQARQGGNFAQLIQLTRNSISDEAVFSLSNEVYYGNERKHMATTTINKQDLLRLEQIALGMQHDRESQALRNYSFNVDVREVEQIAPGVAMVRTQIREQATLSPQRGAEARQQGAMERTGSTDLQERTGAIGQQGQQLSPPSLPGQDQSSGQQQRMGQDQMAQAQPGQQQGGVRQVRIESVSNCDHLIRRGDEQLMLGMTTCRSETRIQ